MIIPERFDYLFLRIGPYLFKVESPLSKDVCATFYWNWPSSSGEEDFEISSICIFAISLLFPLGEGSGPSF